MRLIFLILSVLLLSGLQSNAQSNWEGIPHPFHLNSIKQIYYEPEEDVLWLVGDIRDPDDFTNYLVAKFDGVNWSWFDGFNQKTEAIVKYGNQLFVAGQFSSINDEPVDGLARFNGEEFDNSGVTYQGSVFQFEIINELLFIGGSFASFNGLEANTQLVVHDGEGWFPYDGLPNMESSSSMGAITQHEDALWVGGNFTTDSFPGARDILYEQSGEWYSPSNGIVGGFSEVWDLEVFQGDLYAGGMIVSSEGNPSNGIIKWGGNSWDAVGLGVTGPLQEPGFNYVVRDFQVVDNKLLLSGMFSHAGDLEAQNIAYWDGERFCALGGDFGGHPVNNMVYYHDELYISCGQFIDGEEVNGFAKYIGDIDDVVCSSLVDVLEVNDPSGLLFPNPVRLNEISIETNVDMRIDKVRIYTLSGELILEQQLDSGQDRFLVPPFLSNGLYMMQLIGESGVLSNRFVLER